MPRVFVTGIGVISALGDSVDKNHYALTNSENGLSKLEFVDTRFANSLYFGEVKTDNSALISRHNISTLGTTRTTLLALNAITEALIDSELSRKQLTLPTTALVVANTVGGMCLTNELYNDSNRLSNGSDYLASYDNGATTLFLQNKFQIKGVCNTINTACSSSANAIMYGARLIKNGYAQRAIVGGTDSLAKFTINGFNSLGILSTDFCKPFDANRNGLNLGEGSGFLVLESESVVGNKKVYAELSGFSNTNDAFHPSTLSSNGEGAFRAMKQALTIAELQPNEIGFINTHGTGTENNDLVESIAMKRIFDYVPAFASSKSKIGHSLGASGSIEAVFCLLALKHQEIYPSHNFSTPISETELTPVLLFQKKELNHVMSNSFGFGGNCSSLLFSKI